VQAVRAHVAHLQRLEDRGALELCGPFSDKQGGMVVLRAVSEAEARVIAESDPFVFCGARTFELSRLELSCRENAHLGIA
jgi:uncharacterized protein YciI